MAEGNPNRWVDGRDEACASFSQAQSEEVRVHQKQRKLLSDAGKAG